MELSQEKEKSNLESSGEGIKALTEEEWNKKRTKCSRYSRIVGYIRPVDDWNSGKKSEWDDRKVFDTNNFG